MLRIQHGFCQAAPMLLLQLYLMSERFINYANSETILVQPDNAFLDMNTVAASLSLFSVCWALASFSKNVRLQNVHRLVLTWLGVIFQVKYFYKCSMIYFMFDMITFTFAVCF